MSPGMPTIAVVDGITIAIYYNDHDPPHFHAMQAEHEILVEIARLVIFAGSAPAVAECSRLGGSTSGRPCAVLGTCP
jgi:Domain of unknown function (DUF4160)